MHAKNILRWGHTVRQCDTLVKHIRAHFPEKCFHWDAAHGAALWYMLKSRRGKRLRNASYPIDNLGEQRSMEFEKLDEEVES